MRTKIAAGNWKMNLSPREARELTLAIIDFMGKYEGDAEVILGPSSPYLSEIVDAAEVNNRVHVSAQNVHQAEKGAFTGEVSASMLQGLNVSYCIIGHSERRNIFGEGNALLAEKINQALAHDLKPIYCVGETLDEREAGNTLAVIREQMLEGCFHVDEGDFGKLVIAYEPVWAIGTGKTATPEQAQEVHAFIRQLIEEKYGKEAAENCSILYGGSVKPANAADLFAQTDIDGGLVGGASLKAETFIPIIQAL